MVGVDTVEFLNYTDGVIEYGLPLRRDLARAIREHQPDIVMTNNFDLRWGGGRFNMADHRARGAGDARRRARRGKPLDIPGTAGRGLRTVERACAWCLRVEPWAQRMASM